MKKWIGFVFMASLLSQSALFSEKHSSHIIVQKGSAFPITQLTLFVPMGSAILDKVAGEGALLEDILSHSPLTSAIESYGGDYSIDVTKDAFLIQISVLTQELPSLLPQVLKSLQSFQVEPAALDIAKKKQLDRIQAIEGNPEKKSAMLFYQHIFGKHPYGMNRLGTPASLAKISSTDIMQFWKTLLHSRKNIYVVAASNQPEHIQSYIENFWESFPDKPASLEEISEPVFPNFPLSWDQKDPRSSQSFIHIGLLFPPVDFSQRPFLLILAEIIGGGFNSRLFTILRAKYGLSYSPHAYFQSQLKANILDITYSTKSSSTKQSISIVRGILQDLKEHGATQKELDTTKKLVYNRLLRLEENNQNKNILIMKDILYKNPLGSINILEERVRDCTLRDLNIFIQSLLKQHPDLQFVLEGV